MTDALALVAHDLKNALGGLEGELVRLSQAPTTEGANKAVRHCQDLRQQFVQFLTLYGAQQGQLHALSEDESPLDLLDSLCTRWAARLPAGLGLTVHHRDAAPPFHHFDRRLVYMALDAAVHNASRFARQRIVLSASSDSRHGRTGLSFTVSDDGPGLGQSDDLSTSTGLGTLLCQAVARVHRLGALQGETTLKNAPDGVGTHFTLWVP